MGKQPNKRSHNIYFSFFFFFLEPSWVGLVIEVCTLCSVCVCTLPYRRPCVQFTSSSSSNTHTHRETNFLILYELACPLSLSICTETIEPSRSFLLSFPFRLSSLTSSSSYTSPPPSDSPSQTTRRPTKVNYSLGLQHLRMESVWNQAIRGLNVAFNNNNNRILFLQSDCQCLQMFLNISFLFFKGISSRVRRLSSDWTRAKKAN